MRTYRTTFTGYSDDLVIINIYEYADGAYKKLLFEDEIGTTDRTFTVNDQFHVLTYFGSHGWMIGISFEEDVDANKDREFHITQNTDRSYTPLLTIYSDDYPKIEGVFGDRKSTLMNRLRTGVADLGLSDDELDQILNVLEPELGTKK